MTERELLVDCLQRFNILSGRSFATDRSLLLGVLALQTDFISYEQFLSTLATWSEEQPTPLGDILVEQGAVSEDVRDVLDQLTTKHIEAHGGDPKNSLAVACSPRMPKGQPTGHLVGRAAEEESKEGIDTEPVEPPTRLSRVAVAASEDALQQTMSESLFSLSTEPPATEPPSQNATAVAWGAGPVDASSLSTSSFTGERFTFLRAYAEGGLGMVSLARDEELGREVALKQIKDKYADDPGSRQRFLLEAEVAGGLEHPGVAPVYSLGRYADGRPYYAMRFIRGESLKQAVQAFHENRPADDGERSLTLRRLLGRMIDVCQTMEYAHNRGVLHRDLKPDNIMLGRYGETLVVDWGLAKIADGEEPMTARDGKPPDGKLRPSSAAGSPATLQGGIVGTPVFMSPEQAEGRSNDLRPASDVYSLGATLFNVLTGQAPVSAGSPAEALEKTRRGEVTLARSLARSLDWAIPRPLEAICTKAMSRSPADRYASSSELAADLERYLADEPVSAWREPWTARSRRWLRRHQTAAASVAVAMVAAVMALSIGLVVVGRLNRRLDTALSRAEHNFGLANQAVEKYLNKVTENPKLNQDDFHELRTELLETAVPFYEEFSRQTSGDAKAEEARADAYTRLGFLYRQTGKLKASREQYQQAQPIYESLLAKQPGDVRIRQKLALSQNNLGVVLDDLGELNGARAAYERALQMRSRLVKEFPKSSKHRRELIDSKGNLGLLLETLGDYRQARVLITQSLKMQTRLTEEFPKRVDYRQALATGHNNLGVLLGRLHDGEAARDAFERAAAIQTQLTEEFPKSWEHHQELARTLNNLGKVTNELGDGKGALAIFERALPIRQRLAEDFPTVPQHRGELAATHYTLGRLLKDLGDRDGARVEYEKTLKVQSRLAEQFPSVPGLRQDLAATHTSLGVLLKQLGDREGARSAYEQAIRIQKRMAEDFPTTPQSRHSLAQNYYNLGNLLKDLGDRDGADTAYQQAIEIYTRLAEEFPTVTEYAVGLAASCCNYGNLLRRQGEARVALDLYDEAIDAVEPLVDRQPSVPLARQFLRNSYAGRARAHDVLAAYENAAQDWRQTAQLSDGQRRADYQIHRAYSLACDGRSEDAARTVEAFVDHVSDRGAIYNAACVYSLASAAVSDAKDQAAKYAARAVELLNRAHDAGYFRDPKRIANLREDADLDVLRQRNDFQEFVRMASQPSFSAKEKFEKTP